MSDVTVCPGRPRKYDAGSKDHVSRLVRVELRDSCLYHQSRTTTGPNARPLIVVLQNQTMRETLALHGRHLIFVDKNYEGERTLLDIMASCEFFNGKRLC